MTILLVVTGFSLVLVYNNLLTSTLLHNGCGNSCVSNVSTNLEGIVTYLHMAEPSGRFCGRKWPRSGASGQVL